MGRSNISAHRLQEIMAEIGLVQEDLAVLLRVKQSTVSRWLGGRVPVPGYVEAWLREAHPHVLEEHYDSE